MGKVINNLKQFINSKNTEKRMEKYTFDAQSKGGIIYVSGINKHILFSKLEKEDKSKLLQQIDQGKIGAVSLSPINYPEQYYDLPFRYLNNNWIDNEGNTVSNFKDIFNYDAKFKDFSGVRSVGCCLLDVKNFDKFSESDKQAIVNAQMRMEQLAIEHIGIVALMHISDSGCNLQECRNMVIRGLLNIQKHSAYLNLDNSPITRDETILCYNQAISDTHTYFATHGRQGDTYIQKESGKIIDIMKDFQRESKAVGDRGNEILESFGGLLK